MLKTSAIESFDGKRSLVRNINTKDTTKYKTNDLYYIMTSLIESFDGKRGLVRNINTKDITKYKTNDLYSIMIFTNFQELEIKKSLFMFDICLFKLSNKFQNSITICFP